MNNLNQMSEEQSPSLQEDFDNLTNGIQRILDLGAEALAEAEEKTELVSQMDPESEDYLDLIEDIKAAQARSGSAFQKAEELIDAANDLFPKQN